VPPSIDSISTNVVPSVTLASGLSYPQVTFGAGLAEALPFERFVDLLVASVKAGIRSFDIGNYNGMPGREGGSHADVILRAAIEAAGLRRDEYLLEQKIWTWHYPVESLRDQIVRHFFRTGAGHAEVGVVGSLYDRQLDIAALVGEVGDLISEGLIGAWAINNWPASQAEEAFVQATAQGVRPPEFTQLAYSVARRAIAEGDSYGAVFAEYGLSPQASVVFEYGILAGNQSPDSLGRWGGRNRSRPDDPIREIIRGKAPEFAQTAADLGATPAQLALAYVLAFPGPTPLAIIGYSSLEQLADNLGAYRLLAEVGPEQIREIGRPYAADLGITDPARGVHSDPARLRSPKPVAPTR
jgi:aryl-alcohol dehydrogenase-like predicted oxidoreductase